MCSCGFSPAEAAVLLRSNPSFRGAGEGFEETLRQVAGRDDPLHLVEACDDEPPGLLLEHHAGRRTKGRERTDRCHRRGHDVPDQDLRWVPSGRRDLPQDIAVGDQADGSAILDNNETTDLLRRHPLRRIQDRPFGIDYDDAFRHHVPNEDHAEPRGPCGSHPGRYRSCLGQRATYQSMKASNVRTSQLLRGRRSGSRQDLGPRFLLLPWEALAERIQPQSVLAGRVFRTTEEGPSVPGATPHETAFRTNGAGPVVLRQEEGPLRVERRGFGSVFDYPDLLDRDRLAFGKGRQLRDRLRLRENLPPSGIEDFSSDREERRVPHGESYFRDGRHARGGERREESAGDQVVHS